MNGRTMNHSPETARIQGIITPWPGVFGKAPLSTLISTGLGAGFLPKMPGTWGSLLTLPLAHFLCAWNGVNALVGFALAVSIVGVVTSHRTLLLRGLGDPSEIVIDEVAGQAIALVPVYALLPMQGRPLLLWGTVGIAFLLFRFLDIWKPGPIGRLERLPGGWGVMADDLLAGFITAIVLALALLISGSHQWRG